MEHVRLHLVLANKNKCQQLVGKETGRCFYCEILLYNYMLGWKFRGVGALGRVSDSQIIVKKIIYDQKEDID